jgi:hypothetical protein
MQVGMPHRRKLVLFILFSVIDLVLTWRLLDRPDPLVYEINPLARWSLERLGWAGLVSFKMGLVSVAALATVLVARRRPRVAGHILTFGCSAAVLVVGYSLAVGWSTQHMQDAHLLEAEKAHFDRQDDDLRKRNEYRAVLDRVAAEVAEDRCALNEAVKQLLDTERGRDRAWLSDLAQRQPNISPEASVAIQVILMAVDSRRDKPAQSRALAARLDDELRAHYGSPAGERLAFYIPRQRPAGEFILHTDGGLEIRLTLSFQPEP